MSASYCQWCDFAWPAHLVRECPSCGQPTALLLEGAPDAGWQKRLEEAASSATREPFRTVQGEVREEADGLVISSYDVIRSGILDRLNTDEIVRMEHEGTVEHVEILGYSYEGRVYAVRRFTFPTPDTFPAEWVKPKRRKKRKADG